MDRRSFSARLLGFGSIGSALPASATQTTANSFDVRRFGAVGDGKRLDTVAIQAAIDACAKSGGGAVCFDRGAFLTGTLRLRSRVTLHLPESARLIGSTNLRDYPTAIPQYRSYTDNYTEKSLLYGEDLNSITIEGGGTIDGQGAAFQGPYKVRPYLIRFVRCRDVSVRDVTIENSPMWVQHYLACDGVRLTGLTVRSRVNKNNDGIDIDSCQRVRISDCDISSGDDAICLKSTSARPCRDVAITNCIVSSACNAIKLGTESNGGFENIVVSNCTVYDTRLAGIALEAVDGGTLNGVTISNITMRAVAAPLFIRLGDRARPFVEGGARPPMGRLTNITIQGVQATGAARTGCALAGLPGHPITGITLRDITISSEGGGAAAEADREIPEQADRYPEYKMFGVLPAHGLYVRHAANLCLDNVRCTTLAADARPAFVCDDVEGLDIARLAGQSQAELLRLQDVRGALIHACRTGQSGGTFLRVRGVRSKDIALAGNDMPAGAKSVVLAPETKPGAVRFDALNATVR